jgi:hypothetical protein
VGWVCIFCIFSCLHNRSYVLASMLMGKLHSWVIHISRRYAYRSLLVDVSVANPVLDGAGKIGALVVLMRHASSLSVSVHPPQQLDVPALSGACTNVSFVPLAAVRPRPLQHRQVPVQSGDVTDARIPRAVVLSRPPQHGQVPASSGGRDTCSRPTSSRAAMPTSGAPGVRPQRRSGTPTSPTGTRAPAPLQRIQVPALSGEGTRPRVSLAPARLGPSQLPFRRSEFLQLKPHNPARTRHVGGRRVPE